MNTLKTIILGFIFGILGGAIMSVGGIVVYHFYFQNSSETLSTTQNLTVQEDSAAEEATTKVSPSVVSIVVSKELGSYYKNYSSYQEIGGGTGFVISEDGLILTNRHVVTDQEADYTVVMSDDTTYDAEVLSRDPVNDLAILKIEAEDLEVVELGDSSDLNSGQTVIAIGNSLAEYQNTVTKGIISGLARDLGGDLTNLIQTDASINQGNSGGPLINLSGQVIGINVAIDRSELAEGIGFAIPIDDAKSAIESVQKYGRIIRPMLGIRYIPLTDEIAQENNLDYNYGALIIRGSNPNQLAVIPGSPADKAGLVENDIILEIDGTKIDEETNLSNLINKKSVGDTVVLKIYHDGEESEVTTELTEMNSQ